MPDPRETIIRKYRNIAHLPDFLFGFTFPLRRKAVARLQLTPGAKVLDVGCSSGANFNLLYQVVGQSGEIMGVDISPDMVSQARLRVKKSGWKNVRIIEAAAEEVKLSDAYDGLLLFAMHDVLTSPPALDHILASLKPGGRVVAAGPKLPDAFPGKVLSPLIRIVFSRFAMSKQDMDCPWRLLAERVQNLQVEEPPPGISYLVQGVVSED